eukprot:TRINITY_DN3144_c0_g1_i2.p1 TRINITY_DN3144_c0_g1~~TRINITY_DN3144_c0_g1_i2.p1  ORF type:complete len:853 (+),score=188.83 TRINITY_DN3144_c0_g1_i2:213-2771(+)
MQPPAPAPQLHRPLGIGIRVAHRDACRTQVVRMESRMSTDHFRQAVREAFALPPGLPFALRNAQGGDALLGTLSVKETYVLEVAAPAQQPAPPDPQPDASRQHHYQQQQQQQQQQQCDPQQQGSYQHQQGAGPAPIRALGRPTRRAPAQLDPARTPPPPQQQQQGSPHWGTASQESAPSIADGHNASPAVALAGGAPPSGHGALPPAGRGAAPAVHSPLSAMPGTAYSAPGFSTPSSASSATHRAPGAAVPPPALHHSAHAHGLVSPCVLHIGELHHSVDEALLSAVLDAAGRITSSVIRRGAGTQQPHGSAYVHFARPADAERGLQVLGDPKVGRDALAPAAGAAPTLLEARQLELERECNRLQHRAQEAEELTRVLLEQRAAWYHPEEAAQVPGSRRVRGLNPAAVPFEMSRRSDTPGSGTPPAPAPGGALGPAAAEVAAQRNAAQEAAAQEAAAKEAEVERELSTAPTLRDCEPAARVPLWGRATVETVLPGLDTQASYAGKMQVCQVLRDNLVSAGYPKATVYLFGSTATGLAERAADLDIACDLHGTRECPPPEEDSVVCTLTDRLKSQGWQALEAVPCARVPIIRNNPALGDAAGGLRAAVFDLSFRLHGVLNSNLFRRYAAQHPAARLAAVAAKCWSKAARINNPRGGRLSSYAVVSMLFYALLRRGYCKWEDPAAVTLEGCPPLPPLVSAPGHTEEVCRQVGRVLAEFWHFYAKEFSWETEVVSLQYAVPPGARVLTKADLGWDRPPTAHSGSRRTYNYVCIADPYERREPRSAEPLNLGRRLNRTTTAELRLCFIRAWKSFALQPAEAAAGAFVSQLRSAQERAPNRLFVEACAPGGGHGQCE